MNKKLNKRMREYTKNKKKNINAYKKIDGITVVSPMYGDMSITDRMIHSVIYQFISKKNPFKIHLVLVDDYIEKRGENNESYYDYYLSDEFKKRYDNDKIKISIIKNDVHKYQGDSREIGFLAGDYDFFILLDCDDMLAPNACDRYIDIIRKAEGKPPREDKKEDDDDDEEEDETEALLLVVQILP